MQGEALGVSILGSVALTLLGIFLLYMGRKKHKLMRTMRDLPTFDVQAVSRGPTEVRGNAFLAQPQDRMRFHPITGEECVYYRARVEYYQRGDNAKWVTLWSRDFIREMLVSDRTGTILVRPDGAEFDMIRERSAEIGSTEQIPETIGDLFGREGISPPKSLFGSVRNDLRIFDEYVPVGGNILVLGTADPLPVPHYVRKNFEVSPYTIWKKGKNGLLQVTDRAEREILKKLSRSYVAFYINGVLCLIFALVGLIFGVFVFINL
ncbi:MAG: hypothetical protein ACMUHB_02235 [Thermoplasmatota archaeon]